MTVLDASALLAFLLQEPGEAHVARVLPTSIMSSANLAETLTRLRRLGVDVDVAMQDIEATGLTIIDATEDHAKAAAKIDAKTMTAGLSLGDRLCLALAIEKKLPVLTTDKVWAALPHGASVIQIR